MLDHELFRFTDHSKKGLSHHISDYLHLNGNMNMKNLGTYLEVLSRYSSVVFSLILT